MSNIDTAQSLELRPYQRMGIFQFIMTAVLPSFVLLAFYIGSESLFWLTGAIVVHPSPVGGRSRIPQHVFRPYQRMGPGRPLPTVVRLNMYFLGPGRPLPTVVRLAPEGIAFTTKAGKELRFNWNDVDTIHDHFNGRRYKHHVEIRFKQSSERLLLYRTSMKISERDGQAFDNEFGDGIAGTIDAWDRLIRVARSIIAQHVPDFKA